MKLQLLILLLIINYICVYSQQDRNSLIALSKASTTELNAIAAPKVGSLAFDTTKDRVVQYTSEGWQEFSSSSSSVYVGSFIISGTGDKTIRGLPFSPSSITFRANANIESVNVNDKGQGIKNDNGPNNTFGTMTGFARRRGSDIIQQIIFIGGSGNSINDISRYSSNSNCVGIRYTNQDGADLGVLRAQLTSFESNGFKINVSKSKPAITNEKLLVLYTAYR